MWMYFLLVSISLIGYLKVLLFTAIIIRENMYWEVIDKVQIFKIKTDMLLYVLGFS